MWCTCSNLRSLIILQGFIVFSIRLCSSFSLCYLLTDTHLKVTTGCRHYKFTATTNKLFVVTHTHTHVPAVPPDCLLDEKLGTHEYVTAHGIKFHYVTAGDRSKPLMLFLHGFPEVSVYFCRHKCSYSFVISTHI